MGWWGGGVVMWWCEGRHGASAGRCEARGRRVQGGWSCGRRHGPVERRLVERWPGECVGHGELCICTCESRRVAVVNGGRPVPVGMWREAFDGRPMAGGFLWEAHGGRPPGEGLWRAAMEVLAAETRSIAQPARVDDRAGELGRPSSQAGTSQNDLALPAPRAGGEARRALQFCPPAGRALAAFKRCNSSLSWLGSTGGGGSGNGTKGNGTNGSGNVHAPKKLPCSIIC